jgi:hypothetical protein
MLWGNNVMQIEFAGSSRCADYLAGKEFLTLNEDGCLCTRSSAYASELR